MVVIADSHFPGSKERKADKPNYRKGNKENILLGTTSVGEKIACVTKLNCKPKVIRASPLGLNKRFNLDPEFDVFLKILTENIQ